MVLADEQKLYLGQFVQLTVKQKILSQTKNPNFEMPSVKINLCQQEENDSTAFLRPSARVLTDSMTCDDGQT